MKLIQSTEAIMRNHVQPVEELLVIVMKELNTFIRVSRVRNVAQIHVLEANCAANL